MQQRGQSEVLIVGAGPAGCAAGITLARLGIDVCVLDRAVFPRDKVCGDAISNDGMQLLETLGAAGAVQRAPHAVVRRAAAVFPDRARIERDYDRPGYIVPRLHLDDCLRQALEGAGARVLQGHNVTELEREGERVVGALGADLHWRARVVIAADGYGSVGLPALGQSGPKGRLLAVSATAYYRGVSFPNGADTADHYFEQQLPYGYGWVFPEVDGTTNLGVYLRADGYARTGRKLSELMHDFVERRADRLAGAARVGKVRVWSLPVAPRPWPITGPGLLLCGDAGGFVDPLSGEGIWQALHTGVRAGEIAARAIARGELTPALRADYERACAEDIGKQSRKKAMVQDAMTFIVDRQLYRSRAVRALLGFGYRKRALEMTKS
jgi:geranylgeranyl reductase family protein